MWMHKLCLLWQVHWVPFSIMFLECSATSVLWRNSIDWSPKGIKTFSHNLSEVHMWGLINLTVTAPARSLNIFQLHKCFPIKHYHHLEHSFLSAMNAYKCQMINGVCCNVDKLGSLWRIHIVLLLKFPVKVGSGFETVSNDVFCSFKLKSNLPEGSWLKMLLA